MKQKKGFTLREVCGQKVGCMDLEEGHRIR